MDAILGLLAEHLGDVPGLPSPQAILEAGDVEEQEQKELRRQREEALKQQFAASRVRVVDHLGRSYATGALPHSLTAYMIAFTRRWMRVTHVHLFEQLLMVLHGC